MSSLSESSQELLRARKFLDWSGWLLGPVYLLVAVTLFAAFLYAPTERVMGEVQRIFYVHFAAAINSFVAFFCVFVGGIGYLATKRKIWDTLAVSAAEVGLMLTAIVLTTGPIWAKPIWNTWFPWGDPRVMTELVLLLIFISYMVLRSVLPDGETKYKFSAVFGIIGFLDVPIVWMSIRWWRTIHPVVVTGGGMNLESRMKVAVWLGLGAILLLTTLLILLRMAMRTHDGWTRRFSQALLEGELERK